MEQLRPQEIFNSPVFLAPSPNTVQTPKPETHTREFVVGEMKEEPSTIKIDFFGGDKPNDFINQPTEAAKPPLPGANETSYINPLSGPGATNPLNIAKAKEELQGSMKTLIALIDYALSILICKLAGEGTSAQYTADTQQKKLLETALVDFFYEKQVKMSAGLTLFLAVLGAYGFTLLSACQKRFKIVKGEKVIEPKKYPGSNYKAGVTEEEIKKMQEIAPPVKAPIIKPQLETVYTENKKDGTLVANNIPKWLNPDPNIVAQSKKDLEKYNSMGIYPMFLKNTHNNNTRKIKYNPTNGNPITIGRPGRVKQ